MTPITETKRLIIRKFNEDDAGFIFILLNSPGWLRYIGNRNIKTLNDARQYIVNGPLFSYLKFGFGPYLIALKDTNIPIGMCSLIKREELADVDLGFALLPGYTGKAYAFEASDAVLNYAKKDLGIKRLLAITNVSNNSSVNLLKKLGFGFENEMKLEGEEETLFLFSHT